MEWLHFSDFHIGGPAGPQSEAMGSLIRFIQGWFESKPGKIDAIFLVGDIAWSGHETEYARFEEIFLKPLMAIPSVHDARVYAVPGNHDVDCDAATPISWTGIQKRNQQLYFCEDGDGQRVRKPRAEVFRSYWEFVQRNAIISPNPFEEVSSLDKNAAFPFDILALNTSFFSDKEEKASGSFTPCPLMSLRDRLKRDERNRPVIILGHHPPHSFLEDQQKPFETLLLDEKAVYLHGHEHNTKVVANVDGTIRSLGFGATYAASLSDKTSAPYRNSFTRCRVDERFHLNGYNWDSEVGRWDDNTRSQFSACITQTTFDGNAVTLAVPLLSRGQKSLSPVSGLQNLPRKTPQPQSIALVSAPSVRVWLKLLALSDNVSENYRNQPSPSVPPAKELDGKIEFVLESTEKRDLLVCIPASSHILSAKEIESYNTRLDTEDYRSVAVLSFGKISTEARDMYRRLSTRKPIEVLVNRELAAKWQDLLSTRQTETLARCDTGKDAADVLIDDDQVHLLIVETGAVTTFRIVDSLGELLPATHQVVAKLREANPLFAKMQYHGASSAAKELFAAPEFDESAYLRRCYEDNNVMKYAALANVGLRFSDFSLEHLYIDASASEVEPGDSNRIDALLDDHLAAYPASEKLKAQIKQQFIAHAKDDVGHETSQAREFCQKFGAVLLTGDPGSGKTCFVKSEILAYAKRARPGGAKQNSADEWHSVHVPVMIQLSQAAAEADLKAVGILRVAAKLLERRGVCFPADKMEEMLRQGRLALFFDGLDEIVSVEKRAEVVQHINELVGQSLPLGNRVVVTSRPAAINVVNLLPALRQLELQGLTEAEIRTLANRILTLKLAETSEGVILDEKQSRASDSAIVKQLLQDCREKPGVARLAKNPLLLTLLVMIYANSGAPSAKRHRIYEEAVKTLAAVRGRQTGHDPVSAQDLRERLGAVALSVYRKESGLLPTRAEVADVVRGVMSRQRGGESVERLEADKFIQKIAESTGLIALGGDERQGNEAAIVTFMHHSFMEYFAAVGLSRDLDNNVDVVSLVTQPRWVEILTLLAGIIGESEDIAPVLGRFIGNGDRFGDVDSKYLTFALDCALECEVPSEAAIRLLSSSISKCIETGPGRCDPWIRSEIGHRLSQLIAACGISAFESSIAQLMRNGNTDICAAAISLASYACDGELESSEILKALEQSCSRGEENIQGAICEAAARVKWFRTPLVLQIIAKCLKKSHRSKCAAFEAILAIPGLAAQYWPEIINGLDDSAPTVRRLASRAAVQAGLDGDLAALNGAKKDVVANALQCMYESSLDQEYPSSKVRQDTVEGLVNSGYLTDRVIGIQMIPAVESAGDFAYRKLLGILDTTTDHQEMTAALRALRSSRDTRVLCTVDDLKRIVKLTETGTADVRIAGIQLLGLFGADASAVRALLDRDVSSATPAEYEAIFAAIGRAQVLQDDVTTLVGKELMRHLEGEVKRSSAYVGEMCALLDAALNLSRNLRPEVSAAVRQLIRDHREDHQVSRAALRAYPAIAMPTCQVVDFLTKLFESPPVAQAPKSSPVPMMTELVQTPRIFAKNCRQSVEYVIACVKSMSALRDAAVSLHKNLSTKNVSAETEFMISELRDGICAVSQIIVTFEEFINPATRQGKGSSENG